MPFQKGNKFGGSNKFHTVESKKAARRAYAREYRKTHPHDPTRRRMYYMEAKPRDFAQIIKKGKINGK